MATPTPAAPPPQDFWPALARLLLRAGWAPAAVILGHQLLGLQIGREYAYTGWFHFAGGMAGAFFAECAFRSLPKFLGTPKPIALRLLALCITVTAALLWEFGELAIDLVWGTHIQERAREVLFDLFLGMGGAALYCALSLGHERSRTG